MLNIRLEPERGARLLLLAARQAGTLRGLYDPDQPRDEQGQWTSVASSAIVEKHGITLHPESANFLLRDGTLVRGNSFHHQDSAERAGTTLQDLEKEGVVRMVRGGAEVPGVPSSAQAKLLADHWNTDRDRKDHFLDVTVGGITLGSVKFEGKATADAIRNFAKRAIDNPRDQPPIYEVRHLSSLTASRHPESALHRAADAHVAKLSVAFRLAFAMGRRNMKRGAQPNVDSVVDAMREALEAVLPKTLRKVLVAGGEAGLAMLGMRHAEFNPDQPRDEDGKWTAGYEHGRTGYGFQKQTAGRKGTLLHEAYRKGYDIGVDSSGNLRSDNELGASFESSVNHYQGVFYSNKATAEDILIKVQRPNATLVKVKRGFVVQDGEHVFGPKGWVLRSAKDTNTASLRMRFDAKNQHVIDWADRHAAELITQITETTREAINNAVAEHQKTGDWDTYYDEILAAVGDTDRADLIARHETMLAASEGQRQGWDQAVESGLLNGDEERVWIVTGDEKVCPICEGLEDRRAKLGEPYVGDDGEEYDGPPAHVRCRCTEGIA